MSENVYLHFSILHDSMIAFSKSSTCSNSKQDVKHTVKMKLKKFIAIQFRNND